jgi:eukaryotic-like serine/threonine-protein kinase
MALTPGTKLGPYEVVAPLGAGGMGEVWRAHDSRLSRDVALKVLPDSVAQDATFLARFQAEARAASALNHPNIVTVYDVGQHDGHAYISMELLEGKSLRAVLDAGAPPLRKTLQIATQIADGLAAAHAKGIVHRDLKPENVIVTKDGVAKVLDFGLAKTSPLAASADDETVSAAAPATTPGTLLGTVGYMSPEQASGHPVDFRADQFSLGTILHELLTGKRTWKRATPAETLTAILRADPPSLADTPVPAPVRWIVDRCLAKDPEERYASTRDLARDLRQAGDRLSDVTTAAEAPSASRARPGRRVAVAAGFVALGLAAGAAGSRLLRPARGVSAPVTRFLTYSGQDSEPAISPDGKLVAFTSERGGKRRIWLKQLADGSEVALTAGDDRSPRFSPDGAAILFTRVEEKGDALYRTAVLGGEPRRVAENAYAGDYSPDGETIAFLRKGAADTDLDGFDLVAVPARGGPERVILDKKQAGTPPRWSPDGRWVATANGNCAVRSTVAHPRNVVLVSADGRERKKIELSAEGGEVVAASWLSGGRILFAQLDRGSFATRGRLAAVLPSGGAPDVLIHSLAIGCTAEPMGPGQLLTDALSTRFNLRETVLEAGPWRDASPRGQWLTRGSAKDRQPVYSPDGKRVLFTSDREGNEDLWELNVSSGAVRRLTDHPASDADPAYSPDGKQIVWSSDRSDAARPSSFEIWIANADGTNARPLTRDGANSQNPTFTADGQWVFFASYNEGGRRGIWKVRPDGTGAERVLADRGLAPAVSPDGKHVLFLETGAVNVLRIVRVSDGVVLPMALSAGTGDLRNAAMFGLGRGRWSPDGKSIAFSGVDDAGHVGIYVQDFDPARDTAATRRRLVGFTSDFDPETFAFSPDGKRFVAACSLRSTDLMVVEGLPAVFAPGPRPK